MFRTGSEDELGNYLARSSLSHILSQINHSPQQVSKQLLDKISILAPNNSLWELVNPRRGVKCRANIITGSTMWIFSSKCSKSSAGRSISPFLIDFLIWSRTPFRFFPNLLDYVVLVLYSPRTISWNFIVRVQLGRLHSIFVYWFHRLCQCLDQPLLTSKLLIFWIIVKITTRMHSSTNSLDKTQVIFFK